MKKYFFLLAALLGGMSIQAQQVTEKLGRATVAVKSGLGILVSWRALNTDAEGTTFNVYKGETLIAGDISATTSYLDKSGVPGDVYTVQAVVGGSVVESTVATAWDNMFMPIKVKRPAKTKDASGSLTANYFPDDASVGDVDGDGEYEIILKWFPDNQRDSGKEGKASPTYMGCYKLDGTHLWSQYINFGHNIRSGNHTMQFLVYDFDGDGKAEIICRTAAGTTDADGKYVSEASTDAAIKATDNSKTYQNSKGYVTGGEEFLTVFEGATGKALHTIWYRPNRGMELNPTAAANSVNGDWGDTYSGRAERFNAAVAYLDGLDKLPSAVMQRGYYTQCFVWAVNWNGSKLSTKWIHCGTGKTAWNVLDGTGAQIASGTGSSSYGQGVHGISVGDVDLDGFDEIVTGGATIDHDGSLMCSTGKGHGDAIHLADLCPDIPGLEIMMPHEESPFGYDVHKASDGTILTSATSEKDNGRGLAADFIPSHKGSEFWSSADDNMRACEDGSVLFGSKPDTNFRIYWTGDPFDQTFDGRYDSNSAKAFPRIRGWRTSSNSIVDVIAFADHGQPQTCNTTKATPCLQADILGDWREEILMYQYEPDNNATEITLMLFSTPEPTKYKVNCLMQDHVYRMGVAWQNSSYNQPPHLGYSLAEALGIDRAEYTTNTNSHAPAYTSPEQPAPDPSATKEESINGTHMPSADKEIYEGVSFIAGENGELTSSSVGEYLKVRTNMNDEIVISVKDGYTIVAVSIEAYSNNTSDAAKALADRSIDLTGVFVDGAETSVLSEVVSFPGGTAGQTAATASVSGIEAAEKIVFKFDNSKISVYDKSLPTTVENDANGKNKQLIAKINVTYRENTATDVQSVKQGAGKGNMYNLQGMRIDSPVKGQMYILDGKLYMGK